MTDLGKFFYFISRRSLTNISNICAPKKKKRFRLYLIERHVAIDPDPPSSSLNSAFTAEVVAIVLFLSFF
jgi:hypothetical protein